MPNPKVTSPVFFAPPCIYLRSTSKVFMPACAFVCVYIYIYYIYIYINTHTHINAQAGMQTLDVAIDSMLSGDGLHVAYIW